MFLDIELKIICFVFFQILSAQNKNLCQFDNVVRIGKRMFGLSELFGEKSPKKQNVHL